MCKNDLFGEFWPTAFGVAMKRGFLLSRKNDGSRPEDSPGARSVTLTDFSPITDSPGACATGLVRRAEQGDPTTPGLKDKRNDTGLHYKEPGTPSSGAKGNRAQQEQSPQRERVDLSTSLDPLQNFRENKGLWALHRKTGDSFSEWVESQMGKSTLPLPETHMTITAALALLMQDPDGGNWVSPKQQISNINMGVQYVHNFILDTQGLPLQGFGSPDAGDGRNSDNLSRLLFGSQVVLETLHRVNTSALNDRWEALIYLASNPTRFPFRQCDSEQPPLRLPGSGYVIPGRTPVSNRARLHRTFAS